MDGVIGYFDNWIHDLYLVDPTLFQLPRLHRPHQFETSLWRVSDYLNGRGAERWRR